MTAKDLLDPEFLRALEALRRRLEIRARSAQSGDQAARRRGGSAEFQEHRAYAPGDDLRRVDWLAYARTGEPVVKLFRAEEDVVVRLLVDASKSLDFGTPTKLETAQRLAAAIGYLALSNGQRVQALSAAGTPDEIERGSGLARVRPIRRGRGRTGALFDDLDAIRASGRVDLTKAIEQVARTQRRPGLLVVISDFFDSGRVTDALDRARASGNDIALVQVLARTEIEPDLEGDLTLLDSETGDTVDVTLDARALTAYRERLNGLFRVLAEWSKKHGASYVRVTSDESLESAVRRFVSRAVD